MAGLLDRERECKECAGIIEDADGAVYDGSYWFCNGYCHGRWVTKQSGGVPS